ncbi:class III chitinase [Mucidula mucida]|nr:class III chitinase [Mucidula mucida]
MTFLSFPLLAFNALILPSLMSPVVAFDNSRYDNVSYWGQNSYGATHSDVDNFQKTLSFYCNTCNSVDNATFPGTDLPDCSALASDITQCQAKGKIVTISLGGATGSVGFGSDDQARTFANTVWNLFLGGSSDTRPFGNAVLDGVDLDIEGGTSSGYPAFVNEIRSLSSGANKQYYITAAPQCVFPDAALGGVLNSANFDAIYGEFYASSGSPSFHHTCPQFRDNWARTTSPNPNVKVYIGAPGSSTAAGSGYIDIDALSDIAVQMRNSFPSFGGVMLWDASQAYVNGRYDLSIKNALVAAGGTGFPFPACSAPTYVSGGAYTGGSQVSFDGQAKWWTSAEPASNPNGDWSAITACSGSSGGSSTTTSVGSTPTSGGSCAGIDAWAATSIYTAGQQAVYQNHLWSAQWWTQGDTPGGSAGVWLDKGVCTSLTGRLNSSQLRILEGF